jgi:Cdc6-like AAA superfamily ATPase
LDSAKFQNWLNSGKQTLYCHGIPGAGKTILTSIIVDDLGKRYYTDTTIGIAYLYCNFRQTVEADGLVANILKQLVQCQSSPPKQIQELYDQHQKRKTRPELKEILDVFQRLVGEYSKVFIVIDALDELPDRCRTNFLSTIFIVQKQTSLKVLATSRPTLDIEKEFRECASLESIEISAIERDVYRYLEGQMSNLCGFLSEKPALQEEIKKTIVEAVEGMYVSRRFLKMKYP